MIKISPSLLACDFSNIESEVKSIEKGGAEYIHLDVMDGVFVPNISFGPCVIKSIRSKTNMIFDVHLMITDPIRYIEEFVKSGADIITFHYESCDNVLEVIDKIKSYGKKAAISIKPGTSVEVLKPYLDKIDMVLIMTVEPGFGGQKYIDYTTEKISLLKELIGNRNVDIEVDGGIDNETIKLASKAGANIFVAGSSVFKKENRTEAISLLRKIALDSKK